MNLPRANPCAFLILLGACAAPQREYSLTAADLDGPEAMAKSMPRLAEEVLATYRDDDRTTFLDNRFRLQMLTGRNREAAASLAELRTVRQDSSPQARALNVQYEILVAEPGAFAERFREAFSRLDDRTAALAARAILLSPATVERDLRWATPDQTGKTTVSLEDALTLLRVVSAAKAYREFAGLPEALVAEDDARRYAISTDVPVKTPDGATVCAVVVRPRAARGPLPALMQFTIYADPVTSVREAILCASNGYVGVTGFTRGKGCSPDKTVPYVHDGADAAALIDWIAAQPWSDGRVAMYGGSYSGFTAWAAAKRMPRALKAILVGAPVAPGIDVPMEGNVFWNFVYPWPFFTTNDRWLDNATYNDFERWNRLNREWYAGGRTYRELEGIDGTPNPIFAEWLAHPTLDEYWRATIPQGEEYAKITIPVLQTAGYFHGGPGGAVHYFLEHAERDPRVDHRLLIGPYDHLQAQRGVITPLGDTASYYAGYETDPVAWIDIVTDLRFRWFDHVLRGGPLPELLSNRVNYQVMGANVWKHAPSIAAASNDKLRLDLGPERTLTVDLADRSDVDVRRGRGLLDTSLDEANGITLVSAPLSEATEVSGLLSGHLELIANKKDFDFTIAPYEWTADGQYFHLPPYTSRASHVASPSERRLLTPGKVERLDFASRLRMVSRRVGAGSRLVVVLSVVKNPGQQINYGTGKDVSDESVADAGEPLSIRWLPGSYVEFPVWRRGLDPVEHVFASPDGTPLKAFVFSPPEEKAGRRKLPAIVLFHGGGWAMGEPAWAFPRAKRFANRGMVAVAAQYRLSDQKAITPLEAMADARAAIRWMRAEADSLGIDPDRIAAYGWSAGGQLAASAAIVDEGAGPNALVLVSPAVSLAGDGWVQRLLGARASARDISPDENVRPGLPPTLILQGDVDTVTPLRGAIRFRERMVAAGNRCELHLYEGFGHLFTPAGIPDDGMPEPDPATAADAAARAERFLESLGFLEDAD